MSNPMALSMSVVAAGHSAAPPGTDSKLARLGGRKTKVAGLLNEISGTSSREPSLDSHLLRQRMLSSGAELASEEVLSFVLSLACEDALVQQLKASLLAHFGSVGAIIAAPAEKLAAVLPGHEELVAVLKSIHHLVALTLREPLEQRTLLRSWSQLESYLRATLAHEKDEVVRLLLLDPKNSLIRDDLHSRGEANFVQIYPRKIVERVLELNATALIIVHNHPSGDPTPSEQDITLTKQLSAVFHHLRVKFHDHVIVGRSECVSLRRLNLMG